MSQGDFKILAAAYGNDMGSKQHDKHKWVLGLDKSDELLILNGEWLTDAIIIAGQNLIKERYSHIRGFQSQILGFTLSYEVMKSEFVQVVHNGTIHWVTLSTIGCAEGFIDIHYSHHPQLNLTWQQQIAFILFCQEKEITVNKAKFLWTRLQINYR